MCYCLATDLANLFWIGLQPFCFLIPYWLWTHYAGPGCASMMDYYEAESMQLAAVVVAFYLEDYQCMRRKAYDSGGALVVGDPPPMLHDTTTKWNPNGLADAIAWLAVMTAGLLVVVPHPLLGHLFLGIFAECALHAVSCAGAAAREAVVVGAAAVV
eukprot:gene14921-44302_t